MKNYIWLRGNKVHMRSGDEKGERPTYVRTSHDTHIRYEYSTKGVLLYEAHYKNNKWHRDGGKPSQIWYEADGKTVRSSRWGINGVKYKDNYRGNIQVVQGWEGKNDI